jgi:hypothetical protein
MTFSVNKFNYKRLINEIIIHLTLLTQSFAIIFRRKSIFIIILFGLKFNSQSIIISSVVQTI